MSPSSSAEAAPAAPARGTSKQQRESSPISVREDDATLGAPSPPQATWSSGVPFYPPSTQLWRIGGKWYDFEPFLKLHPGGEEVVRLARDRFEDSTYAFESHHHNYAHARRVIAKYEVPAPDVLQPRPAGAVVPGAGGNGGIHALPLLTDDDAFYSVVRRRLTEHLRSVRCPSGGPTAECLAAFWVNFAAWIASWLLMYQTGSFIAAVGFGIVSSLLGAFGHNWVHQPKYRVHSYLSLDTIGFSSTDMYTNTPWDNHFRGTDPFLVTDPTVPRHWVQRYIMPYVNPILLSFGLWANYIAHLTDMFQGNEAWRPTKLILPLNVAMLVAKHGVLHGALLSYLWAGTLGIWYFTMALMNHNAEHCMDVDARNRARDWGEAQLVSSADWGVQLSFRQAWIYLWLNYHTVHHLFPRLDFSHHPAAQRILMETCKEMGVKYVVGQPLEIYREMVTSFGTPRSLAKSIMVYSGDM